MYYEPASPTPPPCLPSPSSSPSSSSSSTGDEKARFLAAAEAAAPPKDANRVVWLIFLLHGVGTLIPWNMFITIARAYFEQYKLREDAAPEAAMNATAAAAAAADQSSRRASFMTWVMICSQAPNLLLNFANIFAPVKGDLTWRIVGSMLVVIAAVVTTDVLVYVDTSSWVSLFFYVTLALVVLLNGANGVYQNSVYGLVSDLPFAYTNAVIIGNNFCGTLVTLMNVVAVEVSLADVQLQAFVFFSVSLVVVVACLASFFALRARPFFRYYAARGAAARRERLQFDCADYADTLRQGWPQFANVFIVFFVTLALFPAVMVNVRAPTSETGAYDFFVKRSQYENICCFLLFNACAFAGSMLASIAGGSSLSPRVLTCVCWLRLLFIPALLLCNYQPTAAVRTWPVLIANPFAYMAISAAMSLSSGYCSSLAMMYAPRLVTPRLAQLAGMISAFVLIAGIVSGVCFSSLLATLVAS